MDSPSARARGGEGRIAVVVLCYNDRKWLERCLTRLLRTGAELLWRCPAIARRRHLEMHAPQRLPEMAWLHGIERQNRA